MDEFGKNGKSKTLQNKNPEELPDDGSKVSDEDYAQVKDALKMEFPAELTHSEVMKRLQNPIPKSFIKEHSKHQYVPIGIVEAILHNLVPGWWFEIVEAKMEHHAGKESFLVVGVLHYRFSEKDTWRKQYGIGAQGVIKASDGTGYLDALQKAAPAAESYAIKDAAHKMGRIFGGHIDRQREGSLSYNKIFNVIAEENKKKVDKFAEKMKKNE